MDPDASTGDDAIAHCALEEWDDQYQRFRFTTQPRRPQTFVYYIRLPQVAPPVAQAVGPDNAFGLAQNESSAH
jgi:hypothetical protein